MKRTENNIGQRIALVILLFVGVLTIGVGFLRIRTAITSPFNIQISKAPKSDANPLATDTKEDPAVLKARDTDSDGLSDFDELYVHRTSPYLKDTDSDGFKDKQELDSGHDPNCATGKVCFDSIASTSSQPQQEQAPIDTTTVPSSSAAQADLEKLKNLTPVQVRELLKEKGFTDEQLKDIDDETLVTMYRQSLEEAVKREQQNQATTPQQSAGTGGSVPPDTASPQVTPQDLANLSKDQIIKLLSDTGELSQDQLTALQKLDDKTVRSIFMQSLQNAQNTIDTQKGQ